MKQFVVTLLALCLLVGLTSCESRTRSASSQVESPSSPEVAIPTPQSAEASPSSSEPVSEAERAPIEDAEKTVAAKEIVTGLFERARVADELFRGVVKRDSSMFSQILDDKEYFPVTDDRFHTVDHVRDWWMHTFTTGGTASARFEEMQNAAVFRSMNGELYVLNEQRQRPITMGDWRLETMEILLFEELEIEVRMEAFLLGSPEGKKILRIVKNGNYWLLGDSYFLD